MGWTGPLPQSTPWVATPLCGGQWRRNDLKVGGHFHFLALKAQLVVLVSAFVMISTVWSVFCLLFFYSRCPSCPAICKSGRGQCLRAPWSRRHWRRCSGDCRKCPAFAPFSARRIHLSRGRSVWRRNAFASVLRSSAPAIRNFICYECITTLLSGHGRSPSSPAVRSDARRRKVRKVRPEAV